MKTFEKSDVTITMQQILAAVTAQGETSIGTSLYAVKVSEGTSLTLSHALKGKIGHVQFFIQKHLLTIDVIDSAADLQGGGLGRLLLACACVYGQSQGATTITLTDNITNMSYWQGQLNNATGGNIVQAQALIANLISHWGNLQVPRTPTSKSVDMDEQQKRKGFK